MAFDYDAPSPDPVPVIDAIRAHYRLPELSQEEKEQRRIDYEIRCEEQAFLAEERRIEREHQRAEAEAAARHEAALEQAEHNRRLRLERQEQIARQVREREMADLRLQSARHQAWQSDVDNAARRAVAVRQQQLLLADVERHFNPPPPPPEPEIIYVEATEETARLGYPKLRSWWD